MGYFISNIWYHCLLASKERMIQRGKLSGWDKKGKKKFYNFLPHRHCRYYQNHLASYEEVEESVSNILNKVFSASKVLHKLALSVQAWNEKSCPFLISIFTKKCKFNLFRKIKILAHKGCLSALLIKVLGDERFMFDHGLLKACLPNNNLT